MLASNSILSLYQHCSYHLLGANLSLLVLARDECRARHDGWADGRGRAEGGPGEGAEDAGVHGGLSGGCGSARCRGGSIGRVKLATGCVAYRTGYSGPAAMVRDGVAGGSDVSVVGDAGKTNLESCRPNVV